MFKRILVPIDGSETSSRGLDEALRLALLTGASLKLVHVLDELASPWSADSSGAYRTQVMPNLKKQAEHIVEEGHLRAAQAGIDAETQLLDCDRLRTADAAPGGCSSAAMPSRSCGARPSPCSSCEGPSPTTASRSVPRCAAPSAANSGWPAPDRRRRMCFSATASFTAGALLIALGSVTVSLAAAPRERPFAAIPLLFGLQQLIEGGIWLSLQNGLT